MTRFADDLFDDLMREHGQTLAHARVPAQKRRHLTARPVLMTAGAGGLAAVAAVGTLVATGGGSPAYAVTTHPDGTVTLAVYQQSGIAGANSKLHDLGDRVVVVPIQPGCPSIGSLPVPAVPAKQISVQVSGSSDGSVTVDAHGIPAGDILVLGVSTVGGQFNFFPPKSTSPDHSTEASPPAEVNPSIKASLSTQAGPSSEAGSAHAGGSRGGSGPGEWIPGPTGIASKLTSGPAPSCVSVPTGPATNRP